MRRTLPASIDAIDGLRAARWFRESTAGQFDNFGPDAQRRQQNRAIERHRLADTGLEWSVASSGWKDAWRTPAWEAMLAAARAGAFEILVVGYVSRFLRNVKQTLIAIEDHLQSSGVVVLFADERLLSSDPDHWGQLVRLVQEAEAFSRQQSKQVRNGYEEKRASLGIPGGNRAPFGLVREGHPSVLRFDEATSPLVRQVFELAAASCTDWEVAAQTGLAKTHVGEILTNPIYMGRLRTGEAAGIGALIEPALWMAVQTARERRRTRAPGRVVKRSYALRLRCAGCQRYLYGDVGRYRHPAPTCAPFRAAVPLVRRKGRRGAAHDARIKGHSYPQDWYEDAVGAVLERIGRVDDATIAEVVALHGAHRPRADELALSRIGRARDDAGRVLTRTRDLAAWQAAMARLDTEERIAREPVERRRLTAPEIVDYARSLPRLWAESGPDGRQALVSAIFARLDVLGFERLEYELTPDAIDLGLDAALPPVLDLRSQIGEFGRGERTRPRENQLIERSSSPRVDGQLTGRRTRLSLRATSSGLAVSSGMPFASAVAPIIASKERGRPASSAAASGHDLALRRPHLCILAGSDRSSGSRARPLACRPSHFVSQAAAAVVRLPACARVAVAEPEALFGVSARSASADVAMRGAPPFPGDAAFQACATASRGAAPAEASAVRPADRERGEDRGNATVRPGLLLGVAGKSVAVLLVVGAYVAGSGIAPWLQGVVVGTAPVYPWAPSAVALAAAWWVLVYAAAATFGGMSFEWAALGELEDAVLHLDPASASAAPVLSALVAWWSASAVAWAAGALGGQPDLAAAVAFALVTLVAGVRLVVARA